MGAAGLPQPGEGYDRNGKGRCRGGRITLPRSTAPGSD